MTSFWWNVLAVAVGNSITFILWQGFVQSYWGKNCREEITRVFDNFSKHMRKQRKQNEI